MPLALAARAAPAPTLPRTILFQQRGFEEDEQAPEGGRQQLAEDAGSLGPSVSLPSVPRGGPALTRATPGSWTRLSALSPSGFCSRGRSCVAAQNIPGPEGTCQGPSQLLPRQVSLQGAPWIPREPRWCRSQEPPPTVPVATEPGGAWERPHFGPHVGPDSHGTPACAQASEATSQAPKPSCAFPIHSFAPHSFISR